MEQVTGQVINFSLNGGNTRMLDRVLDEWLTTNRGKEFPDYDLSDWVSEFRIYVNQAESFQS